jgi:hypothetical protein
MSSFISKDDYAYHMRVYKLDQILDEEEHDQDLILDTAEEEALAMIEKHLADKYDMNTVLSQSGANRNKVILRWAKVLVIYYIYERVPDEMVPERVVKNYNEVMEQLRRVEDGKASVSGLPPKTELDGNGVNQPVTRRRWGSVTARTNDAGSPRNLKW